MNVNIPADLSAVTDEELATIETDLLAEFDEMHDAGTTDIASLTEIAEAIEVVRGESLARAEAAEAAAEAIAALRDRVRPVAAEGDEDEAGDEGDDDEAEAVVEEIVDERELVTASAPKPLRKAPSAAAVSRRAPRVEAPKAEPEVIIAAAADVQGFAAGQSLSTLDLAKALHAKARTLSNGSGMVPVASVHLPIEHKLGADLAYNMDVLEKVTAPEALTAAGWCAPSQNMYEIFSVTAADGLIDLPTVQVTRGGLNVPTSIDYNDAAGALWNWTEAAQDDPAATKPCLEIPCPTFTDYRLAAEGLCVTAGNLTDRAFPELTRRFVDLAINSHMHRLSAVIIGDIMDTAVPVVMNAVDSSAAGSILYAIDLQVADYRSQYRMSVNSVLEVILPVWAKELIRADFAMRDAAGYSNVTDAMIEEHFAARKVRAQFVHEYQPLYSGSPKLAFPGSIDFIMYPAGGYVRGDGGTIDLGVVRDSVLNSTNDFTAAWTEQLYLVAQMGPPAREVSTTFSVDGVTGCCPAPTP